MEQTDNYIGQWFNAIGVQQNYKTMQYFAGDGDASRTFEFNFDGGYISKSDVKAFAVKDDSRERIDYTLTFIGPNSVNLNAVVPVGWTVLIYRDTPKSRPLAKFIDGAVINAFNLDRNAQQAVFAVAEMVDRFDSVTADVETALTEVYKAITFSEQAVAEAQEATRVATESKAAALAAESSAAQAALDAAEANVTADSAKLIAEGIEGKADLAISTANTAKSTADTAKATADAAKVTAEGIEGKADAAIATANSAKTESAAAKTTANEAKATANAIDGKAQEALDKATQAQADVSTAVAGKVSKSGDTMIGPLILNADATDPRGAVTKQQLEQQGGAPLTSVLWWHMRSAIPAYYIPADGQILTRSMYPGVWQMIADGKVPVVPESTWLADPKWRGCYTVGNGVSTFRVPDYNGKSAGSHGAVFLRGDGLNSDGTSGTIQRDAIRDIVGDLGNIGAKTGNAYPLSIQGSGAFTRSTASTGYTAASNPAGQVLVDGTWQGATFKASNVVPTGADNRPVNATGCYVIRMAGGYINVANIDAENLAQAISEMSTRIQVTENNILDINARPYIERRIVLPATHAYTDVGIRTEWSDGHCEISGSALGNSAADTAFFFGGNLPVFYEAQLTEHYYYIATGNRNIYIQAVHLDRLTFRGGMGEPNRVSISVTGKWK
ncbi:tail fiber protein [Yersinia phage phi80-18]|uniref:Phage tail fiber protein n=1 Tax=Yersinia phage phi80-18 TaxID=1206559 RepID=I7K3G3_9CAUD|nr:tail fiber protein [Yersinia phage phi80-18]CCI88886.2 Phage tail fiber protein [Yersinia phage phi80-18]